MKSSRDTITVLGVGVIAAATCCIGAQAGESIAVKAIVTPEGVFTVRADHPGERHAGGEGGPASGGWSHDVSPGIGESVALSVNHTWGGVTLNSPRLVALPTAGNGTPSYEVPSPNPGAFLPGVAAARDADRAAYLDRVVANGAIRVSAFTSASDTPDWQHVFPAGHNVGGARNVAVSRDGSVIAAGARDSNIPENLVVFFNASNGSIISTWTQPDGTLSALDLTDDGSRAMVSIGNQPRVVDTATGTTIWSGTGSGAGSVHYRISGDGSIITVGGFSFQAYQWNGSTYVQFINFSAPTSWFGYGLTVSRDGSTIGSMARNHTSEELTVRMWDVASGQLLGTVVFPPVPGTFQTAPRGADANNNGTLFAFASWGDGLGVYPEVMVFDRDLNMVDQIDMPGSAFDVAMSPNGQFVATTGKAVHANVQGNGGHIVVLGRGPACPGDLTGDGNVGVTDLVELLACWGPVVPGCEAADLTGDGIVAVPDLLELLAHWGPCP